MEKGLLWIDVPFVRTMESQLFFYCYTAYVTGLVDICCSFGFIGPTSLSNKGRVTHPLQHAS